MKRRNAAYKRIMRELLFNKSTSNEKIIIPSQIKQPKKCLRQECNNITTHNGGYCCAECHKLGDIK